MLSEEERYFILKLGVRFQPEWVKKLILGSPAHESNLYGSGHTNIQTADVFSARAGVQDLTEKLKLENGKS